MFDEPNFYGPAKLSAQPTTALPGSEEKIRIMAERAARREQLFHPLDGPPWMFVQTDLPTYNQTWAKTENVSCLAEVEMAPVSEDEVAEEADFDDEAPAWIAEIPVTETADVAN